VIIEDVRGRYASEGEWYPFKNEMNDGYDTVEWAAALPYSSGKVGMFSGSYDGATQMLAAIGHPPHLAGLFPFVAASNYHENSTYQGGAFEQWFSESWSSKLARDTFNRANQKRVDPLNGAPTLPLVDCPIFVFLAGHKLRLEVSSSNFPRFDRNMNTGEEQAHATRMVKATNVVYHDKARPSALIVPVVP
jgi:predicted acyl esterase